MEYVLSACCLLVLVLAVGLAVGQWRRARWFLGGRAHREVSAICVRCQGRGWIDQRQRTLTFTGEGFADVDKPATTCEACGGSGRVRR